MNHFLILVLALGLLPFSRGTSSMQEVVTMASPARANGAVTAPLPSPGTPFPDGLQLITHLPKVLPQRVSSLAYDGEKFWATIYQGRGRYATFDPNTQTWKISDETQQHAAITKVAGLFESPGGVCFGAGKLWIAGSYGESFGAIDPKTWRVERLFKGKQQDHSASQSYASITFDGKYLWMAWHWFNYYIPAGDAQRLLKIDPESGKVLESHPLPPGSAPDGTHGLTWDGQQLWHLKDSLLSAIDPAKGTVTAQYTLPLVRRPSGLAWDGEALWISEFEGRILRLPFGR